MRIVDDYNGKYAIWAADPKPQPEMRGPKLPKFSSKRFSSYEEMNEWKRQLVDEMVRQMPRANE